MRIKRIISTFILGTAIFFSCQVMAQSNAKIATDPINTAIYPNPVIDYAKITFSRTSKAQDIKVIVYSLIGNPVASVIPSRNDTSIIVDLSKETAGIYFYTILENNRSVITKKFILK